jgi:hypothetical protein
MYSPFLSSSSTPSSPLHSSLYLKDGRRSMSSLKRMRCCGGQIKTGNWILPSVSPPPPISLHLLSFPFPCSPPPLLERWEEINVIFKRIRCYGGQMFLKKNLNWHFYLLFLFSFSSLSLLFLRTKWYFTAMTMGPAHLFMNVLLFLSLSILSSISLSSHTEFQ